MSDDIDDFYKKYRNSRSEFSNAIVNSTSNKRLITAGPGTGKTFTFTELLKKYSEKGLVLSFISVLIKDLKVSLSEYAEVFTFNGYCCHKIHAEPVLGLTSNFSYYPALKFIIGKDYNLMHPEKQATDIEVYYQNLDYKDNVIKEAIRLGNYYDATGHTDSVFRIYCYWYRNHDKIPKYPIVLVDEYQDFNKLGVELIKLFSLENTVVIAGDDDQAIYDFIQARPDFIRDIYYNSDFEKLNLPYCSRCTEVIVDATNEIIKRAKSINRLNGRIDKKFLYYFTPDKDLDSQKYSTIIHAKCTVENNRCPYMGKFIHTEINSIPSSDFEEAKRNNKPCVLIVGVKHFVERVYNYLTKLRDDVVYKVSDIFTVNLIDGYQKLLQNPESNLGWRIVCYIDEIEKFEQILANAIATSTKLIDLLPIEFRKKHLYIVSLLKKIKNDQILNSEEIKIIQDSLSLDIENIKKYLSKSGADGVDDPNQSEDSYKSILCTTYHGSKGLDAQHVFLVGLNNYHFPKNPKKITDQEICQLIVGLTRTRKKCTLVSTNNFGGKFQEDSLFLNWLSLFIEELPVNKAYFDTLKRE